MSLLPTFDGFTEKNNRVLFRHLSLICTVKNEMKNRRKTKMKMRMTTEDEDESRTKKNEGKKKKRKKERKK